MLSLFFWTIFLSIGHLLQLKSCPTYLSKSAIQRTNDKLQQSIVFCEAAGYEGSEKRGFCCLYYFQSCKPLYRFSVTALPFYSLNDSVSDYWAISIFTPSFAPPSSSSPPPSSSPPSSPPPPSSPQSPLQAMIYNIHFLKRPAAPIEREERCDYRLLHPVRPARQRDPLQEDDSGH